MERLTLYSKESCVQCTATERALAKRGITEYDKVMLEENPDVLDQLVAEGFSQAPIVDAGYDKWSGFRPDKIGEYALRLAEINRPDELNA